MLGVTADPESDLGRVREFVTKKNGTHTILWDDLEANGVEDADTAHVLYDVSGIPATYVIDRKGKIVRWPPEEGMPIGDNAHIGFGLGDEALLERVVSQALAEK